MISQAKIIKTTFLAGGSAKDALDEAKYCIVNTRILDALGETLYRISDDYQGYCELDHDFDCSCYWHTGEIGCEEIFVEAGNGHENFIFGVSVTNLRIRLNELSNGNTRPEILEF